MEISQPQILQGTQVELMFLPGGIPLSAIPLWQEKRLGKKITDTSGQKCLEQFREIKPEMGRGQNVYGLLIGMEGWYSRKCMTWKLKGTEDEAVIPSLQCRSIGEIESGLLPTPCR